ncbi:MAG: diguanylate cyclase, partial [Gammaproteobacteria bacterium]|nr:diguanylate cyclase [Gammaproteobacteria bacterium]
GEGVGVLNINFTLIKVLFVSISLGLVSAWVGYLATKILKDTVEQFILIYLVVNISFLLAEHFHAAGILAIVSSVMSFKLLIQKELQRSGRLPKITTDGAEGYASLISWIRKIPAITRKDFRVYRKEAMFIGIFANAGVFISMAILFEPHLLQQYLTEILVIFLLTTVLRASAIIAMVRTLHLPNRWSSALTLAGSKGALAIIMVHSIPKSFVYQEMFEAIVIGIIIFTTFGYTLLLMWHVTHHKIAYQQDRQHYEHAHTPSAEELIYGLHSAIEHDELSHAYNPTYFETLLDNEIARSRRYKTELSAIMIHICSSAPPHQPIVPCETIISILGNVITGLIRNNDYFGRMDNDTFLVLVTNTGLSGTMILTERIDQLFQDQLESNTVHARYGITAFEESDSAESLKEKMKDALRRTEMKPKKNIEIEI